MIDYKHTHYLLDEAASCSFFFFDEVILLELRHCFQTLIELRQIFHLLCIVYFIRVEFVENSTVSGVNWTNCRIIFLDVTKFVENSRTFLCYGIRLSKHWLDGSNYPINTNCRIEDFKFVHASITFRWWLAWPTTESSALSFSELVWGMNDFISLAVADFIPNILSFLSFKLFSSRNQ